MAQKNPLMLFILFHFLWNSKADRIKRKQITQNYEKGGLKMIDIDNYIKGLKCSWIKRLMNGNNPKWKQLLILIRYYSKDQSI